MVWRRRIVVALLLMLVAAAIAYGFWPKPLQVEAVEVKRGSMQVTVEEEGMTRVVERYVVSAPVAGYLRRIDLKAGDAVRAGQRLTELEPPRPLALDARTRAEAQARVAAAEAAQRVASERAVAAAEEAARAQESYQRIADMCKVQCASQEEQDQARMRARATAALQRAAEAALEVAAHDLEAARSVLRYSAARGGFATMERVPVTAPTAGRVLKLLRESEGVVQAGDPLLELGDPRVLEVAVELLSADAVRIAPGMTVVFKRWGGGEDLMGKVRKVEPAGFTKVSALGVEEQRVWVISDFISDPEVWRGLGDGYRVEASFVLWQEANVLQVPASALFRMGEAWAVFVVTGGKASLRELTLGQRNGLAAQVLSGLSAGEWVITHPDNTVTDGVAVRVR